MKVFSGRVAFVTGGASGIGYGIVRSLLSEGMKVVVVDYNQAHLDEVQGELLGSSAHFIRADIADREQVRAAAAEAIAVFGKIHVLCNNAGVGGGGNVEDIDFDAWDRALGVNLGGVVNGVKIIAPLIVAHGEGGHIVNTVSMSGVVPLPLPGLGAYSTAKFAVRGLTESLRFSMAPRGIGVSGLFPGLTRTRVMDRDMSEAGRARAKQLMADAMDPMMVGAAVVEGIRNNTPYIFTHAEFRDEVREIYAALDAAFPEGQEIPQGRLAFENYRRGMAAELRGMVVKD